MVHVWIWIKRDLAQRLEMMKASSMQKKQKAHPWELKKSKVSSDLRRVGTRYQHHTCTAGTYFTAP